MPLRRYRLATTITVSANAADTFTTQRPGTLKQIQFLSTFDCITDNGIAKAQLSRSAVGDFAGSAGAITQTLGQQNFNSNFLTSGVGQPNGNLIVDCNDKLLTGESLYLNAFASGTVSCTVEVILVVEESGA